MKTMKKSRWLSCLVLLAVYTLATLAGLYIYRSFRFAIWLRLLLADVAATMVVLFFSILFENASTYDPYWSVQPIVILTAVSAGKQLSSLHLLFLAVVWLWGLRLTANWLYTFHGLEFQDWRYTMLREQAGPLYPLVNAFGIHLVPTLIVYADILPAVYVFHESASGGLFSTAFLCVSLFAATLQGVADHEMHRFRKNGGRGFIREGVWKHSRHPNYLGEILMWWGVDLAAVSTDAGRPWMLAGALATILMFLFISIPMADRHQSAKPGFEAYKADTGMLLPLRGTRRDRRSGESG